MGHKIGNNVFADQDVLYDKTSELKQDTPAIIPFGYKTIIPDNISFIDDDRFQYIFFEPKICNENKLNEWQLELRDQAINLLDQSISLDKNILIEEGVDLPNEFSIDFSKQLITKLAKEYIVPNRIGTSIEQGICFAFKNKSQILYFEVYNDGDLGYIIEDSSAKATIKNENVFSIDQAKNAITDFLDVTCAIQIV